MNEVVELKNGFTRNQSNTSTAITNARTKMTATELKAFYQVSTLIKMSDTKFQKYEMSVLDFANSLNINSTNRDFIVKTCKSLLRQVFEIEESNGDYRGYTIFSEFKYSFRNQTISFEFNDKMKPFLLEIKEKFTQIKEVKYIKDFNSKYAIRIYALLKDYRKMSYRIINLEALSKMLYLPKSYRNFNFIKIKVLEPALKEINEKSDIEISSIEPIKTGRKVTDIRIEFKNKADKQANDIIARLEKMYKSSNKDPSAFVGLNYTSLEKPTSKNEMMKIARIEADDRPYFQAFNADNRVIFSCLGKENFVKTIINGIYRCLVFEAEIEKKETLPFEEFKSKKDIQQNFLNAILDKIVQPKLKDEECPF